MTDNEYSNPIISTKLHRPAIPDDHVLRSRLVEQLAKNRHHPLILISAPAGYGKSTLACSWLETCGCHSAWLSLDEGDNDLRSFLSYLTAAVQAIYPEALPETVKMLDAPVLPPLSVVSGILINELDMIGQDFLMVMDDFHLIRDSSVLNLMTEVLRHPPRPLHLVLIGRKDPFLPISALRARKQIYELRIEEIRFTLEETSAFLQRMLKRNVENDAAAEWAARTEGWITGLRLAVLSIQHRKDFRNMLPELQGGVQYVLEYLFNEVLSQLQPDIRNYLVKTSILDRFCAPLCGSVCRQETRQGNEEADTWEFISYLKKENMFIISLDAEGLWFRYHHLFQQLLQNQLKRHHSPEEISVLHVRAGEWFESQGLVTEAIHHMLSAGESLRAAEIIEEKRDREFIADRWFIVHRWLSMIPAEIKQERPRLLLTEAWIANMQHQIGRVPKILEKAESLLRDQKGDPLLSGELAFFHGYFMYFDGQIELCRQYLEEAVSKLSGRKSPFLGEAELMRGLARTMAGEKDLAVRALEGMINEADQSESQLISRLTASLVFIYLVCGDLQRARIESKRLQHIAKKFNMPNTQAWSSYMYACAYLHTGDFEAALHHFNQAYAQRYVLEPVAAIDALSGWALTQQLMGLDNDATETARVLERFIVELNDPQDQSKVHSCEARILLLEGDVKSALERAQLITDKPSPANLFMWLESPPVTKARVLIATDSEESLENAMSLLHEVHEISKRCRFTCQVIEVAVLQSMALEKLGRTDEALIALEEAVTMAESGRWTRPFIESGPSLLDMLKQLSRKKVSVHYIRHILAALRSTKSEIVEGVTDDQTVRLSTSNSNSFAEPLSRRELETLTLLGKGLSNKEIAAKLFLSTETVKKHVYNVYQKLYVKSRVGAIARARELGILPLG